MTLRQLFTKIPFDSIVPFVKKDKESGSISAYKEAYDILLHTAPTEEGWKTVEVSLCTDHDGTKYVSASEIERAYWSSVIDAEITLGDGVNITEEELAYRLLWHLTFYGFSPEDISENIDSLGEDEYHETIYGRMARAIRHKRDWVLANKEIRKHIQESITMDADQGRNMYALPMEDWKYLNRRRNHCNRQKRKREWKLEKRQKELANMDRCEHAIKRLLAGQSATSISREDLAFLWSENGRIGTEFKSRAYDKEKRLGYLLELIDKYEALHFAKELHRAVVRIATSSEAPLKESEWSALRNKVNDLMGTDSTIFIQAQDNRLKEEMSLMMVG